MASTKKNIFLDFHINNIVTVNAKQLDTNSRYINVTCTDHGKKVALSADNVSVFIRYKKSDGNVAFNDGSILEDGTVDVLLTQQMLAASGRQKLDLIILATSGLKVDNLATANSLYDLGVTIISTMTFYINVEPTAVEHSRIASTSEFDSLLSGISRLAATEEHMKELGDSLKNTEQQIKTDTNDAIAKCNTATTNANTATTNANNAATAANKATTNANTATTDANNAAIAANNAATAANEATINANNAATAANEAAELCQGVIDKTGVVLQNDKGTANGIATLDASAKIPYSQLNVVNNLTTSTTGSLLDAYQGKVLKDLLDNAIYQINLALHDIPVIHSGTEAPNNSLGKDGDIYMQIIG